MREPIDIPLSAEMQAKFETLPDVRWLGQRDFTAEEDAVLLRYWPVKVKAQVAKMLGRSDRVCRDRFIELTRGDDEGA